MCGIDADHVGDRIWHGRPAPTSNPSLAPASLWLQPLWPSSYSRRLDSRQILIRERNNPCYRTASAGVVDLFPDRLAFCSAALCVRLFVIAIPFGYPVIARCYLLNGKGPKTRRYWVFVELGAILLLSPLLSSAAAE